MAKEERDCASTPQGEVQPAQEKRPYAPPCIEDLGSAEDLTSGGAGTKAEVVVGYSSYAG